MKSSLAVIRSRELVEAADLLRDSMGNYGKRAFDFLLYDEMTSDSIPYLTIDLHFNYGWNVGEFDKAVLFKTMAEKLVTKLWIDMGGDGCGFQGAGLEEATVTVYEDGTELANVDLNSTVVSKFVEAHSRLQKS